MRGNSAGPSNFACEVSLALAGKRHRHSPATKMTKAGSARRNTLIIAFPSGGEDSFLLSDGIDGIARAEQGGSSYSLGLCVIVPQESGLVRGRRGRVTRCCGQ